MSSAPYTRGPFSLFGNPHAETDAGMAMIGRRDVAAKLVRNARRFRISILSEEDEASFISDEDDKCELMVMGLRWLDGSAKDAVGLKQQLRSPLLNDSATPNSDASKIIIPKSLAMVV
jgi:hypothetical protein